MRQTEGPPDNDEVTAPPGSATPLRCHRGEPRRRPGPFGVLLHSPELAARIARVGAYVRYESSVPRPLRELAILVTAAGWECAYEWVAHEPIAKEEGVGAAAIDVAMGRSSRSELAEPEATVVRYVQELLREKVRWRERSETPPSASETGRYRIHRHDRLLFIACLRP